MTAADGPDARRRALTAAAFASTYLFWGGTFLAIRFAVAEVPPLLTIAIRCAGGTALLGVWLWWRGDSLRVTRAQWTTALMVGALFFLGCHASLAWAEQRVSSGQAALMMATTPIWLVLLDALRHRRRPSPRVRAALGLGVLGVALLVSRGAWTGGAPDLLVLLLGALAWAVGSLVARDGARPANVALSTAAQLAAGAVWVLVAAIASGELQRLDPSALTPRGGLSLVFLVVCGTVLGFGAYSWLLRVVSPLAAGTYAFVNPVVALLLGWAAGDGAPTAWSALATMLVVGAVVLARPGAAPQRA